jgi:hypothetical protein
MHPITIRGIEIEDAIASAEYDVIRAKASAYDLLMHRLQSVLWHARNPMQAPAPEPVGINLDGVEAANIKTDGAEPPPVQAPATEPAPDADPFAAAPVEQQGQPQPRRGGRRRLPRTAEEAQAQRQEDGAQPVAEPAPEEGQPLTAEALGLTPEPAPQPLPLTVVEAPDVSAAPTSADDVYGTEPAEDPFA